VLRHKCKAKIVLVGLLICFRLAAQLDPKMIRRWTFNLTNCVFQTLWNTVNRGAKELHGELEAQCQQNEGVCSTRLLKKDGNRLLQNEGRQADRENGQSVIGFFYFYARCKLHKSVYDTYRWSVLNIVSKQWQSPYLGWNVLMQEHTQFGILLTKIICFSKSFFALSKNVAVKQKIILLTG